MVGVDANPEAHEHARLRYRASNLRFERDLVESFAEPADAVVFLQTIEHLAGPRRGARALPLARRGARPGRAVVRVSTPNVLTLAPKGAERSDNPWHMHEYRAEEFEGLCRRHFAGRSCTACSTRASCACTSSRCAPAGTGCIPPGADQAFLRLVHAGDRGRGLRPATGGQADLERALDFVAVCRP